jgi:hypothetical protein
VRIVAHVDMDAFYAAGEAQRNPALRARRRGEPGRSRVCPFPREATLTRGAHVAKQRGDRR